MSSRLPETVLQFGTGKFLRAFADLFIHEANQTAQPVGRVVVVQSIGAERARVFNEQGGRFHVAIRGLDAGQRVDRAVEVESVSRALEATGDWDEVLAVARSDSLRTIVSNTTEAGFALHPDGTAADAPPRSFPGKLLAVLKARFEAGLGPLTLLPCELLEQKFADQCGVKRSAAAGQD